MNTENVLQIATTLQMISTVLYLALKLKRTRRWRTRRWWVHPINQLRRRKGHFENLFQELKSDEDKFFSYTRMGVARFYELLELLIPKIKKRSRRTPIGPEQRLAITFRYLATGDEILSLALAYRIGESTTRNVIQETCFAIVEVLKPVYVSVPTTEKWIDICNGFLQKWNLPNCVGAVDGKHVVIQAPPNSGSQFLNYKKTFSIVIMAICDHDYKFTLFDIGSDGSQNDAGIFKDTWFGRDIYDNGEKLNLPGGTAPLPGVNGIETPWYFVGDAAFGLSRHLMKPYPGANLNEEKKIFNYRLSRARRVIENAFGILSARWRVLRKRIFVQTQTADSIVMACVCLHNYLKTLDQSYCPPGFTDLENNNGEVIEGQWRNDKCNEYLQDIKNIGAHRSIQLAYTMRDTLAQYFLTESGAWQYENVRQGTHRFL